MKNLRPIKIKQTKEQEIETQFFMGASNPFMNFNNWLKNSGDNGGSTGDEAQLGNNNFINSPSSDPHSVTLLGATIFEVKSPYNAALVGQNNCIDDGAVGVYGESHGKPQAIGVAGACDPLEVGCGVAGTATASSIFLPQVGSGAGVFGAGDGVGVYGASLAVSGWDLSLGPTIGSGVLGRGDAVGVSGDCVNDANDAGYGVVGTHYGAGSGVFGASGKGPGGKFSSGELSQDGSSSNGGIAQLRLVPSADSVFPVNAQPGDLYAHVRQDANRAFVATLWLCVKKEVNGTMRWGRITTNGLFAGGTNIP